jgi:hypothetical protein
VSGIVHLADRRIVQMADAAAGPVCQTVSQKHGLLRGQFGDAAWEKERAVIDLVGEFIASVPLEGNP